MKQLFAFSILFCLVFLNVPRSFVHDCDHTYHVENHESDDQNQSESRLSFSVNQESCFICEFDLGFFNVEDVKISSFASFCNFTFNEPSVDYLNPEEFKAFSHRGPPVV